VIVSVKTMLQEQRSCNDGGWYDKSWSSRLTVTINHEKVCGTEDKIDFPVYFVHQSSDFAKAQPSGADFVFTSGDGTMKLCHEIRSWSPADCRLVAYVKLPRLSAVLDTKIFLYYGNPKAVDQQNVDGVWSGYAHVRHLSDKPSEQSPPGPTGGTISRTEHFQMQRRVLEDLFGADWFTRPSKWRNVHPAYEDWKFCTGMIESGGQFQWRDNNELQALAMKWARVMRNNWSLVQCTRGDVGNFGLGHLANYGDEKVMRRLQSVKLHHEQYLDLLAEFLCVAWFSSQGQHVTVSENPGWADFQIVVPAWAAPVVADCKRISRGSTGETLKSKIKKANKQIKQLGIDSYGLVILNASDLFPDVRALDDTIPPEISEVANLAQKVLSRYCTAISAALLVWDEVSVLGPDPHGRGVMFVLRTKSMTVEHLAPIRPLPEDSTPIRIGCTITNFIHFPNREWV